MSMVISPGWFAPGGDPDPGADPYWDYVVLLMGFNGTDGSTSIVDESKYGRSVTVVGDAQIDTADKKFGTGSLLCTTAAADYIEIPDSPDFIMGGSFTMECWFQPLVLSDHYIMGQGTAGGFAWNVMMVEVFALRWGQRDFVECYAANNSFTFVVGTQHHLVVERSGGIARLYVDGVMVRKATIGIGGMTDAAAPFRVGLGWPGAGTNSRIDEVRVTNGIARYDDDAGYTVPTTAFPRHG